MKHIWVLCGGPSTEFEVSLSSGRCVCEAVCTEGRVVTPVIVTRKGGWLVSEHRLEGNEPRDWLEEYFRQAKSDDMPGIALPAALQRMLDEKVECAFLAFHGQYGEDGAIQGLLQTAGIPYTGSGILASALAFNKAASLDIFAEAGLAVAKSAVATRKDPTPPGLLKLTYPLFTKPVSGGSSVGVSLVKKPEDVKAGILHALEHDERALIEEKIEGVEVSCGVVDFIVDDHVVSRAMPPTLISPTEAEFFDYEAKYVPGKSKDVTPAPLPPELIERLQETALVAHKALFCEGMSRTDMIILPKAGAVPFMLETQTIPGLTPTSLIPQQCVAAGISFAEFIDLLISHSFWRANKLRPHE
jgi:D-alanine-D-alanine ligase